jgi:hypothetical protein
MKRGRKAKFNRALFNRVIERILEGEDTTKAIQLEGISTSAFYKAVQSANQGRDNKANFAGDLSRAQKDRDIFKNRIRLEEAEEELRRRAIDGWEEPRFYQGRYCGSVRRYSDTALIVLLKSLAPEKYRESVSFRNIIQTGLNPECSTEAIKRVEKARSALIKDLATLQAAAARNGPISPDL